MGYRALLKSYIAHVNALIGNDLVEIAAITNAINKRDLGELRALAAELQRETFDQGRASIHDTGNEYHKSIRSMVAAGTIRLDQLGRIKGIETGEEDETIPEEQFRRIVQSLSAASED